ncbi:tRNA threonylcarbamoyl adenosine modification protein YeaZ [Ruegeria halocynthiae]|uniref:tRNA threonylcarbamoyl adenosine modification protein YeaZ n=1 Tax=Ruegeria halocynthiae TaxID=985054 RepID=A0A1H2Z5L1_9RHOB|nr:tRNA (adenosine(37)-N6)-threonylcarbamoyltransferase complex dimerization subunit type 1 TsaB [Ruegeria halocynthiae]SDX12700.1 tRNA threonylcarbamoyl adenosine modification protein YeaZ [Ruegeria halocynthiae]
MRSDQTILAFDTSAAHCAAALLRAGEIVATRTEAMTRGQAERLMPLLQELLTEHNCTWQCLTAIGVGIGPGNFTGIRISVSAARGLALGLGVPAVGVSGFDALMELAPAGHIPAIPAPRDQVYLQPDGEPPYLTSRQTADAAGPLYFCDQPARQACAIARVAARQYATIQAPPAPLYIRPADAAPSSDVPPVLLDE